MAKMGGQEVSWKPTPGGEMKGKRSTLIDSVEKKPQDTLEELVGVFRSKKWLNQTLRIHRRGRRYRIYCSEKEFFAYRINDNCGISPGFPGWLVCMVTGDHMLDDAKMGAFPSTEPSIHEWVQCIAEADFEFI
jgi:hypothetical protein